MRMDLVYSRKELKTLDAKTRKALKALGTRLVRTSPAIRKMIQNDPKIHRKLKTLMRPQYQRLKKKK